MLLDCMHMFNSLPVKQSVQLPLLSLLPTQCQNTNTHTIQQGLLLLPLLLLPFLCLMPAAQAMDYVKCEAMQKALTRASERHTRAFNRINYKNDLSIKTELCGPKPEDLRAFAAWQRCNVNSSDEYYRRLKLVMNNNPEYEEAISRLKRIKADIDAEGCY